MKKLLSFISGLLLSITSFANTYYVATASEGGSNSNPGTISQPFLTWQYAISQMTNSGDTTSSADWVILN